MAYTPASRAADGLITAQLPGRRGESLVQGPQDRGRTGPAAGLNPGNRLLPHGLSASSRVQPETTFVPRGKDHLARNFFHDAA